MSELNPTEAVAAESPAAEVADSPQAGPAAAAQSHPPANGQPAASQETTEPASADGDAGEPPVPTAEETIAQLQEELARAQARADEYLDRLQRTAAEFQNSRRRQEKQVAEQIERASLHMVQRLIPILDDLDRAFQNVPPDLAAAVVADAGADAQVPVAWVDGFRQIQKKLHALVEEQGVEAIPLAGPFDPTRHEAISSEPHAEVASGHIIETLRVGYEQRGHVIRPALVRIAQ